VLLRTIRRLIGVAPTNQARIPSLCQIASKTTPNQLNGLLGVCTGLALEDGLCSEDRVDQDLQRELGGYHREKVIVVSFGKYLLEVLIRLVILEALLDFYSVLILWPKNVACSFVSHYF
jgi:hypothetical protein